MIRKGQFNGNPYGCEACLFYPTIMTHNDAWPCYPIFIIQMIQPQYDESLPLPHELKVLQQTGVQLHQLQGRQMSSDVMSLRFDREGDFLAMGCKNGARILYNSADKKYAARFDDVRDNAITSLKWRPTGEGKSKILVAADAGGYITFHHVPSLKPLFALQEQDNSIHTLDYSPLGRLFATAGKDFHIRIYDDDTKTLLTDLLPAGWNNVGHDNRVFAVRFIDENTLISGGWDSVVHMWDLRQGKSARHFYGPNISGQSLDYSNGTVLAGCYAAQRQLQFYDIKSGKKIQEIDWSGNVDDAEYLYCASYSRHEPTFFGAGSTGPHSEVRLYREAEEDPSRHTLVGQIGGLSQGCFALDFSSRAGHVAFSTPHHGLYVYDYRKTAE